MKRVIETSEIIGSVEFNGEDWEICATANAAYDATASILVVRLDAFLRFSGVTEKERLARPDWLPAAHDVRERASYEEAGEIARDIFHRWVQKIRQAAPAFHAPTI